MFPHIFSFCEKETNDKKTDLNKREKKIGFRLIQSFPTNRQIPSWGTSISAMTVVLKGENTHLKNKKSKFHFLNHKWTRCLFPPFKISWRSNQSTLHRHMRCIWMWYFRQITYLHRWKKMSVYFCIFLCIFFSCIWDMNIF